MRVFDFTLLSGYEFSGVDVAQGFRARLFAKNNVNAKFIFTELPTIRDMELYGSQKIKRGQIMSAHLFMTGRLDMSLSVKKEALLENEKENYEYDNIDEDGKVIRLYNSGEKSVEILCDEDGFVINESLFKNGKKYLENYYTDSLSYTELYNWDNDSNDGLNLGRRIFWNKQGQMVYEQCIYKDNVEYLFKNGEVIDNVEFLERFVKTLNLCENDICIMDRAGYLDYIQPLFENKGKLSVESEEMNRKKSLQYDQVLQRQRDLIYATRKKLLDGASVEQEKIVEIAKENISDFVNHFDCIQSNKKHGRRRGRKKDSDKNTNTQQYTSMLNRYILDNISYKLDAGLSRSDMQSAATVSDYLMLRVYQGLSRQRERIGDEEAYEQFVREATLKAVDDGWVELIDYLEQLKYAVAGRASAQRNVMFEYQNEAFESFLDTEKAVKCNIIRNILLSDVKIGKDGRLQVIYP